jgi:hypothetical protein
VAVVEEKLARGEHLPELKLRGPVENFLPEPNEFVLARLAALPEDEQDSVFDMISLLIDIDVPAVRASREIADLRRSLRGHERGGNKDATWEKVDVGFDRSGKWRADGWRCLWHVGRMSSMPLENLNG